MTAVVASETPGGDPFDGVAPGVELGRVLAAVDPSGLVGQGAAAWMRAVARQRNHYDWQLLGAIQEACRSRADSTTRYRTDEFAPHVAAAGLGWSPTMAATRHELACFARDAVPALGEAMRVGVVEERKAAIFHSALEGLELPQCARVVEIVLPEAPGLGYAALRARILEVARDVDPAWAAARLAAALARARVSTRTAPSGACDLAGQDLPPDLAQDAKAHLDALAARVVVRLLGVGLDLGKGFVAARVFTRLLDGTLAGADDPAVIEAVFAELCENPPEPPDLDGPDGPDSGPSDSPDSGPSDNGPSDNGPDDSGPSDNGPDDSGPSDNGPSDNGPDDNGPECGPGDDGLDGGPDKGPSDGPDDGPGDGPDDDEPSEGPDSGPSEDGQSDDEPHDGPGGDDGPDSADDDSAADPAADPAREPPSPVVLPFPAAVALRVRLSTLLGLDHHPADLPGLTGTTPDQARRIALAHGTATWHVLVHDDTGENLQHLLVLRAPPHATRDPRHQHRTIEITAPAALLDALDQHLVMDDGGYSTWLPHVLAAYRHSRALDPDEHPATTTKDRRHRLPRTALARWIDARDPQCVAPGCTRLARRCDHDHTLDWAYGGRTQADQLANLCRRHHRGKHTGRWHYQQPRPGRFEVTDPTGTVHHTRSRVTHPLPGPIPRQYPFPSHLLDLDPPRPRPDFQARPTRDGHITTEARDTETHLSLRAADRAHHAKQAAQPEPTPDDSDPPF